jgi:GNAT superfamily N-acetyltransferase
MVKSRFDPDAPVPSSADVEIFRVSEENDDLVSDLWQIAKETGIRFNSNEEPFSVAVRDGDVIGGTVNAVYPYPEDSLDTYEWSFSVVVSPTAQGLGVGKRLIADIIKSARRGEFTVKRVSADVVNDNLRVYLRKIGFSEGFGRLMFLDLQ